MLLETFLSVKEIRATLGNIDRSHFSREFRNYCGLTPTELRRRLNIRSRRTIRHTTPPSSKFRHNLSCSFLSSLVSHVYVLLVTPHDS